MSSKNTLQEYYQKQNKSLPEYTTIRAGGPDHKPLWVCQILLDDGNIIVGKPSPSRKAAEISAAEDALEQLNLIESLFDLEVVNIPFKTLIMIDVENQPNALENITKLQTSNVFVIGFISTGHPLHKKLKEKILDDRVSWWVVESTRKNAADIGMSYATGVMKDDYTIFIIISNDGFSDVLADCLKQSGNKAFACRSVEIAIDVLRKIKN